MFNKKKMCGLIPGGVDYIESYAVLMFFVFIRFLSRIFFGLRNELLFFFSTLALTFRDDINLC